MSDKQIPREAETLLEYLDRVKEAYRIVREFEEWRATVPSLPGVPNGPLDPSVGPKENAARYHGSRLREAVLSVLEENPDRVYRAKEVMAILVNGGMTFDSARPDLSISRCLSRAMKDGEVTKQGRGLWQWKPGNPTEVMDCGMCDREAVGEMMESGVWRVGCDGCGDYEITPQARAMIEEGMRHDDLATVRNTVRSLVEGGERPVVTTKALKEWASPSSQASPTPPITEPDDDLPF